jgi:hypothetical protein
MAQPHMYQPVIFQTAPLGQQIPQQQRPPPKRGTQHIHISEITSNKTILQQQFIQLVQL